MSSIFILSAIGLLSAILLLPRVEFRIKLRRRAKADYLHARGTIHRNIIQNCLKNLNRENSGLEGKIRQLKSRRSNLENDRRRELETKLTTQIAHQELERIPGIGPVLKDRIIRSCFDGTLESLNRAGNVRGIGYEKSRAIYQWVRSTRSRIPQLLLGDFSGKSDILKKYVDLDNGIGQELSASNLELQGLQQLRSQASEALDNLRPVSVSTFSKAYKGDDKAAELVTRYLVGVFPEWRSVPEWFKTLVEKYSKA